jgi:uroporphyrinogen-III decarboxylase
MAREFGPMLDRSRIASIDAGYRRMREDPDGCDPMFLLEAPAASPPWEERLADPRAMLEAELDRLAVHGQIGDDHTPTVRVEFGTAQVAAAFGCALFFPKDNLPCAGSHPLKDIRDAYQLQLPDLRAGWYGKLEEWTKFFLAHVPEGVRLQHPDIQSAFNTAHLVRGNDILTDFVDDPDAVDALLDKVTDHMIRLVPWLKSMISSDAEWFDDWGARWKGAARISNCTMHLISPATYARHVLPRDVRFMEALGGGRVHYCGTHGAVIDEYFRNPWITGLDFDTRHHDLWDVAARAPKELVLLVGADRRIADRLLAGDWPAKRNVIYQIWVRSEDEGRDLLARLRKAARR